MRSKFSNWHAVLLAAALGGAMGVASAEGVGAGASSGGSAATAVSPGSTDATMAATTTGATSDVQGSPGTQSGPTVMGASSGKGIFAIPGRQYSIITSRTAIDTTGLSGTQLRELERHLALR
jgi:hypothetical protein